MPKKFNPFNAISMGTDPDDPDKDYMYVDDEYLASNIHWKPPVPDEIADWQPMTIPDYDSLRIRSEEHTSELQSLTNLVCRLLLEKKKKQYNLI